MQLLRSCYSEAKKHNTVHNYESYSYTATYTRTYLYTQILMQLMVIFWLDWTPVRAQSCT